MTPIQELKKLAKELNNESLSLAIEAIQDSANVLLDSGQLEVHVPRSLAILYEEIQN